LNTRDEVNNNARQLEDVSAVYAVEHKYLSDKVDVLQKLVFVGLGIALSVEVGIVIAFKFVK